MRRVGVLMAFSDRNSEGQANIGAFKQELRKLDWVEGKNVQFEERWADPTAGIGPMQTYAAELVNLKTEVILTNGPIGVTALQRESRSIPIVFATVTDPVALGFVESLLHPGGNVTGFALFENSVVGKFIEALKEVEPSVARIALLFNPENPSRVLHLRLLETVAASIGITPIAAPVRNGADIERAIEALGHGPRGGLMIPPDTILGAYRDLIVGLTAKYHLPAIYSTRSYVAAGGLMSYGPDSSDNYRRAAGYVDRILKGERPADLPVQQPTKFQFVLNLKTARALGLAVPTSILLRADEVIE
jgi:putative ABC transport system substrate-binding protein